MLHFSSDHLLWFSQGVFSWDPKLMVWSNHVKFPGDSISMSFMSLELKFREISMNLHEQIGRQVY